MFGMVTAHTLLRRRKECDGRGGIYRECDNVLLLKECDTGI